ncbi:hypothetical protein QN277_003764 [Acacia crassicarpa]|uniref:Uncharacterized protein n=1 Tax=Acacia crassicarpa TaxID=499986 RepID=A0AAE1MHR4_9FABA|nr:hypothetical protein QN277_003764 [Acacia crassicarpa]
MERLLHLTR